MDTLGLMAWRPFLDIPITVGKLMHVDEILANWRRLKQLYEANRDTIENGWHSLNRASREKVLTAHWPGIPRDARPYLNAANWRKEHAVDVNTEEAWPVTNPPHPDHVKWPSINLTELAGTFEPLLRKKIFS